MSRGNYVDVCTLRLFSPLDLQQRTQRGHHGDGREATTRHEGAFLLGCITMVMYVDI
jgi:hypothetical protein